MLLKAALLDPTNQQFIQISEACAFCRPYALPLSHLANTGKWGCSFVVSDQGCCGDSERQGM